MAPLSTAALLPLALLFAAGANAAARTHYAPQHIPSAWSKVGAAPAADSLEFTFVLEGDYAGLTSRMEQIAASQSEWLTEDELASYIAPSADAKTAIDAAIKELGATVVSTSPAGDKVTVSTTVEAASKYFAADFHQYEHTGNVAHKTHAYTIPDAISAHVSDVYPIATFGSIRSFAHVDKSDVIKNAVAHENARQGPSKRATPAGCSTSSTTSACYRALYGYSTYQPTSTSTTPSVGIIAYIGQNYSPTDLATWISKYRTDAVGYSIAVNLSNGAKNTPSSPGVEAALDTQTVAGIIYPLPSTFYDIGTASTAGDLFLITLQNFIAASVRPPVITISYGSDESDFTSAQATTMCNAAQQLSALGTTIVVSSGDTGVDGQGDLSCPPFRPTYPGGCPYVLSVGATQNFSPEVMVSTSLAGFYSGSGFSNYFSTPSYQTSQVAAYEALIGTTPPKADYKTTGRAFPDISAQGSLQPVVVSGRTESVGGTSASAPIVAGGLALLNNLLKAAGKPATGWIQPTLYAAANVTTDVTSGGSYACTSSTTLGFAAKPGWDASAGLGTPLFAGLRAAYGV